MPRTPIDAKSGKAGSVLLDTATPSITKWNLKLTVDEDDSTDSSHYDVASDTLYKAQVTGAQQLEGSMEGSWDATTTPSGVIAKVKAGLPVPCVFKINETTTYATGNFNLSDVDVTVEVPGAKKVGFTASVKSNGAFVLNPTT